MDEGLVLSRVKNLNRDSIPDAKTRSSEDD
jgi:hypothetical protein